jgi:hypothetical protein
MKCAPVEPLPHVLAVYYTASWQGWTATITYQDESPDDAFYFAVVDNVVAPGSNPDGSRPGNGALTGATSVSVGGLSSGTHCFQIIQLYRGANATWRTSEGRLPGERLNAPAGISPPVCETAPGV